MSQLYNKVKRALKKVHKCFFWTASTTVLAWLASPSSHWKTFVANRVAEVQEFTKPAIWNYVSSEHDSADIVSRGVSAEGLVKSSLWWSGPELSVTEVRPSNSIYTPDETILEKEKLIPAVIFLL